MAGVWNVSGFEQRKVFYSPGGRREGAKDPWPKWAGCSVSRAMLLAGYTNTIFSDNQAVSGGAVAMSSSQVGMWDADGFEHISDWQVFHNLAFNMPQDYQGCQGQRRQCGR